MRPLAATLTIIALAASALAMASAQQEPPYRFYGTGATAGDEIAARAGSGDELGSTTVFADGSWYIDVDRDQSDGVVFVVNGKAAEALVRETGPGQAIVTLTVAMVDGGVSIPAVGRVDLQTGANVLRWLGADDVPLADALRGLDLAHVFGVMLWNADNQSWDAYPVRDLQVRELTPSAPTVKYGDRMALYLLADQSWNRPVEPPGVIHFSPELPEAVRERVADEVRRAERLLAERFGAVQDRYTIFVAQDWDDAHTLLTDHGRTPGFPSARPSGGCPGVGGTYSLMLVNRSCVDHIAKIAGTLVAVESVRAARLRTLLDYSLWYGYTAYVGFASLGPDRERDQASAYLSEARSVTVPLAELGLVDARFDIRPLQFLVIRYLAETFGDQSLIRYFDHLAASGVTVTALDHAFGLSRDEFYSGVESYRRMVAPPFSTETDRVIILGTLAEARADEIRQIVADVEQWFVDAFGFLADGVAWRVDSRDPGCGLASAAIRIGALCLLDGGTYAHEYFHVLQSAWSFPERYNVLNSYPPFMLEGSAEYVALKYAAGAFDEAWSDAREPLVTAARGYDIALDDPRLENSSGSPEYALGALATEWLEAYSDGKSVAEYYRALSVQSRLAPEVEDRSVASPRARAGEQVFRQFWGIGTEEFYAHFACWRARGFPYPESGRECIRP